LSNLSLIRNKNGTTSHELLLPAKPSTIVTPLLLHRLLSFVSTSTPPTNNSMSTMALSLDTEDYQSLPTLVTASLASADDIEEGGYSSHEDDDVSQTIKPKLVSLGTFTRRLSQCEQLRRRDGLVASSPAQVANESSSKKRRIQIAPSTAGVADLPSHYRRQSYSATSTTPSFLPRTIQIRSHPDDSWLSLASRTKSKLSTATLVLSLLLLAAAIVLTIQCTNVSSLQRELDELHSIRRNLQESHVQILQELHTSSESLNKFKDTHEKMKMVNYDMSTHMKRMKEEFEETHKENKGEMERRVEVAERRFEKMVEGIQRRSAEMVIEK
jgi:hypothetical protein